MKQRKYEQIIGWSSVCQDKKHIIMLDYDHITKKQCIESAKSLQKYFKLSDIYFFKTTKGFHLYCLDKVNFFTFLKIAISSMCERRWLSAQLGNCDKDFKLGIDMKRHKRHFVLRLSKKKGKTIKYAFSVPSENNKYEKSNAHFKFLEKYALPHKLKATHNNFDFYDEIISVKYFTYLN